MKNETLDVINSRRSIRAYKSDAIPRELLNAVLEAGTSAPTGMGRQSPVIIAVESKAYRDRVSKLNAAVLGSDTDPYYGAPVIILVLADSSRPTYVEDASCVLENMMLAAHSLGLGSIWIHRAKEEFEMPEYQQLLKKLGVEGEWEGIGHCAVGYIDGEMPEAAERKPNRVFWVE